MSDTVAEFPKSSLRQDPDSEDSVSLIVETALPMPFARKLLIFVVGPLAAIALLLAAGWAIRALFGF